jgi:hypothetical protein
VKPHVRASVILAVSLCAVGSASPPQDPPAHVLDAAVFGRSADALGDINPVTRMVAMFSARVSDMTLDIGEPVPDFSQRAVRSAIELTSTDLRGTVTVLGSFAWTGQQVNWSWNRVSPDRHRKAIDALSSALATCALDVRLEGGVHVRVEPPPQVIRVSVHAGAAQRVKVAVPAGRAVAVDVASDEKWAVPAEPPPQGVVLRHSDCGDVRISWNAATSEAVVEWEAAGFAALEALRAEIAERRREAARRTAEERRIIDGEIADLERRVAAVGVDDRVRNARIPPFPRTILKGPDGRVYANLEVSMSKKASK